MDDIRSKYKEYGVKNFYQWHSEQYKNPHEPIIRKSIKWIVENWEVDFSRILDMACGKGEITKILLELGYDNIDAVDAYTCKFYTLETGRKCNTISFENIINGDLDGNHYTTIICSFALHLLDPSKLPTLAYKLTQICDHLLIISPHKRPQLREDWGWELENEAVIDRVTSKLYKNIFF